MALTHDHVQRSYVSKGDVLEDALACTCYGSIWAVESAADIPKMLCWHGTIAGSGISKKLLLLGLAAAGGQNHTVSVYSLFGFIIIIIIILWLLLDPMRIAAGLRRR